MSKACNKCGIEKPLEAFEFTEFWRRKTCIECRRAYRSEHMAAQPTKSAWHNMIDRCCNPACKAYPLYGGRGITVHPDWMTYENFLRDVGERPAKGYDLDRRNNNGNYEPGNCRWITHQANNQNKRTTKLNPARVAFLRKCYATGKYSYRQLAEWLCVAEKTVCQAVLGTKWSNVTESGGIR